MTEISDDDIEATLDAWAQQPLAFLSAHFVAADLDRLPDSWRPIALAGDPVVRRTTALALWSDDLLALLPNLSRILRERLADVRVCLTGGTPALVYVVSGEYERWVTWIGYDPRAFGAEPAFWDLFPPNCAVSCARSTPASSPANQIATGPSRPARCRPWPGESAYRRLSRTLTTSTRSPPHGCSSSHARAN